MKLQDEIIERIQNLSHDQQQEILEILKTWQTGKQRKYQRLQTRADIDIVMGDRVIQTNTSDISATGLFINASGRFENNKNVRIVFSVPGHDKPFKLHGTIVRVEKGGVAIQFANITPYFKQILDDIIWEPAEPDDNEGMA